MMEILKEHETPEEHYLNPDIKYHSIAVGYQENEDQYWIAEIFAKP